MCPSDMPVVKSSYEHDGLKITLETQEHTIKDVLEAVDHVLKGSGFYPPRDHVLAYVRE